MSSRPTYSDEFKADAGALVDSSCRPLALVAAELGISLTVLKRWVKLAREVSGGAVAKPEQPVNAAKNEALEALPREVERKNEFLKKCRRYSPENNARYQVPSCSTGGERREKVAWMSRQLGVPRSSYCPWKDAGESPTS